MSQKTVIVTGAGSGIGKACAQLFYSEDFNVVLVGRTEEKLKKVSNEWESKKFLIVSADISKLDNVKKVIGETKKTFGGIDVLVNNAGVGEMGSIDEVDLEAWNKVQNINSTGVFLMSKYCMPHLTESRGSIVNLSSVSGLGGDWGAFAYNASKGAVSNFTRALALDFQKTKVRVNAVAPTMTDTPMADGIQENQKLYDKFMERIPMGRPGKPNDIAEAIYFLSSDKAEFINGVVLPVDGGLSASNGQPPLNS